jgi:hypothetical protein
LFLESERLGTGHHPHCQAYCFFADRCLRSASSAHAIQAAAISINTALSFSAAPCARRRHSAAYWRKRVASFSMTQPIGCPRVSKFQSGNFRVCSFSNRAQAWNFFERKSVSGDLWRTRGAAMAKAEDYRRYAAECLRLARQFRSQAETALLLEMAERWRQLAERAENGISKSADDKSAGKK